METDKKMKQIEEILDRLGGIPPVPAVACRVLKVAGSEDARLVDLARLIASDQGLATQVLRTCNSAYYGIPQRVSSLSRAISLLGFKTIRNLVVIHSLPRRRYGSATFAEKMIWTHSCSGAMAARLLGEMTKRCDPDEAMLGGLIHDAGRLVLNLMIPEKYEPVMRAIYNREGKSIDIETEALGLDHCMIGEAVLRKWSFPSELVTAIRHHHDAPDSMDDLTLLVSAADELLWMIGLGVVEPTEPLSSLPPALSELGFGLGDVGNLEEKMKVAVEQGQELFG